MWRLLCLLLAFVAPAQAAIHCDGFEARMAVTDWVQIIGPKDGTVKDTVAVSVSSPTAYNVDSFAVPIFSSGDFPTTPEGVYSIVGVEFRISAVATNPGIVVSQIQVQSQWAQQNSPFYFASASSEFATESPQIFVGDSGDLGDADYIGAGGYRAIIEGAEYDSDGGGASANVRFTRASFWTSSTLGAIGHVGNPFELLSHDLYIQLESVSGYAADVYIDAVDVRLHYNDASTTEMSGGGTMSAALLKAKSMDSAMVGTGACAATLNAERNIYSDMRGAGKITPVISRDDGAAIYRYLMPELIGTGEVTLTQPIRYGTIRSGMAGSGNVVASISHGKNIMAPSRNGTLALRGSGVIAETLRAKRPIVTALAGSGAISGEPLAIRPISTAIAGSGDVSAGMIASRPVATSMVGTGAMTETLQAGRMHPGVAMDGSGDMTIEILAKRPLVVAMQGTGLLSPDLTVNTRLPAPDGRTFIAPESDATFIAPDDFIAFEATE